MVGREEQSSGEGFVFKMGVSQHNDMVPVRRGDGRCREEEDRAGSNAGEGRGAFVTHVTGRTQPQQLGHQLFPEYPEDGRYLFMEGCFAPGMAT